MNFFVSFKAVWGVIWLFTFIASNCICLKWASVCSLLMSSLSNASLHSLHPISQACYMNLFVSFKTVWCIKWLFTFIASKLSLTKMVFCVFFKTVEAVKFLLTLIASLFSSLSYIYMNLIVSFETVWGVKWLFAFIAPKVRKYARTTRFWSWWRRDYVRSSDPAYLKHCLDVTNTQFNLNIYFSSKKSTSSEVIKVYVGPNEVIRKPHSKSTLAIQW